MKIGLFGGAFDPIHEGHLHIAQLAMNELKLDKVYFIPLYQAVHKNQPNLSPADRIKKIKTAIKSKKKFEVLTDEIERRGESYTIDTVKRFIKARHSSFTDLYYIIGSDAFEQFASWKKPLELLKLVNFIVVSRPGYDFSRIEKLFSRGKYQEHIDQLFFIEDEGIDISSTKIRERLDDRKNKRK